MFLAFLLKNKSLIIFAIVAPIIAGQTAYITLLRSQKATLVAEKSVLTTLLDESQSNLLQLKKDIDAQNKAIQQLKEEGDARVAKNAAEVKKAKDDAAKYKQRADGLINVLPPAGVPKCDAANDLINKEIKNARK